MSKLNKFLFVMVILMGLFCLYLLEEITVLEREQYKLRNTIVTTQQQRNRCMVRSELFNVNVKTTDRQTYSKNTPRH